MVGGGPSARLDLPKLTDAGFKPSVVLSANEHGVYQGHYPVDYLVNVDKIHCALKVPMERHLRQFGLPIINQHTWADFRLVDWGFGANSGITAIAVAAGLACTPVVCVGIDLFGTGRAYFHDEEFRNKTPRPRSSPPAHFARARIAELKSRIKDYPVRPVSGPLMEFFPAWSPAEQFKKVPVVPYRRDLLARRVSWYEAIHPFSLKANDRVAPGAVLPLSAGEARVGLDKGWLKAVDSPA